MATSSQTSDTALAGSRRPARPRVAGRAGLPAGFDMEAWLREACERSGVGLAVSDPVALDKLRTLTRIEG